MAYECTTGCHESGGCKKLGVSCSIFCKGCMGVDCDNVPNVDDSEDVLEDVDEEKEVEFDHNIENV